MNDQKLTTFYIIRHGQTDWNKQKRIQGGTDIVLNPAGEEEARETAKQLKDIHFDLVFSSALLRAKRTAEIIALERNLAVQTTKVLQERNFGKFEGEPTETLLQYNDLLSKLSHEEKLKHKMDKDFESDEEVISRIITFLRETAIAHPGKTILIATHGGIIRMLLIHLGYFTYEKSNIMKIVNGGYIKIATDGVDFFLEETVGLEERVRGSAEL